VKTKYFGMLEVEEKEVLKIPNGILGFPEDRDFCLVDSGDETFIIWLQSLNHVDMVLPLLEPKLFKPDYTVKLSPSECAKLELESVHAAAVFAILTIPECIESMSANLKAPLLIHLKKRIGMQVILQDSHGSIEYPMFKQLKLHTSLGSKEQAPLSVVSLESLPVSLTFDVQL